MRTMSDIDLDLKLRNLYLERKSINAQRMLVLDKIVESLGKPAWESLQRKSQRVGLLTVVLAQLKYIAKLETPDTMQYEYDLVVEDLKNNTWYASIIASEEYKFITGINLENIDNAVKRLQTEISILSNRVDELLGGTESETYKDYLEYTKLGATSTQIKIHMNTTYGEGYTPRFFN